MMHLRSSLNCLQQWRLTLEAKEFEIELYNLNEIDEQEIIKWFPIMQLKGNYLLKQPYNILITVSYIACKDSLHFGGFYAIYINLINNIGMLHTV